MYQVLRTRQQLVRKLPSRFFATRTPAPLPEKWSKLAAEVSRGGII